MRCPEDRNSDRVKLLRKQFVEEMVVLLRAGLTAVYLDETGFNLWSTRRIGRAPRGQRAVVNAPSTPGRNVTLVAAMSAVHGVLMGFHNAHVFLF